MNKEIISREMTDWRLFKTDIITIANEPSKIGFLEPQMINSDHLCMDDVMPGNAEGTCWLIMQLCDFPPNDHNSQANSLMI